MVEQVVCSCHPWTMCCLIEDDKCGAYAQPAVAEVWVWTAKFNIYTWDLALKLHQHTSITALETYRNVGDDFFVVPHSKLLLILCEVLNWIQMFYSESSP